ncbi:class I SAM-dependent methyltransferase [Paenibacillus sp. strain BS8-2]
MAELIYDYSRDSFDNVYSDGDIEEELLHCAKQAEYDWYADGRWPFVYHMSHLRHNILNWFPFKKEATILEIGSGCGAITKLLCDVASKVVSVELTKRRAQINYERHQHYPNLTIIVGDFANVSLDCKFDYIIINGVFEYAAYMFSGNDPYGDFLKTAAQHLNPDGRMLLAIENRLGLKYWTGAREDHTGEFFSGLNGYSNGEKVKTFSKAELSEQLQQSGLEPLKFYYPYPDYKFPFEIFTDTTVNDIVPSTIEYPLDMSRMTLFNDSLAYRSLMDLKIMDKFSNSFLVEVGFAGEQSVSDAAYVKLSSNRNKRFRIATHYNQSKQWSYKKALTLDAERHLERMYESRKKNYGNPSLQNVACEWTEHKLQFPFVHSKSLEDGLMLSWQKDGRNGLEQELTSFRELLYQGKEMKNDGGTSEFELVFGNHKVDQSLRWTVDTNVDLIAKNVFVENGKHLVIDYEWQFHFPIPVEFSFWRMVRQFLQDNSLLLKTDKSWYLNIVQVTEQTEQCFVSWEKGFIQNYVGVNDLFDLSKDNVAVNMERAVIRQREEGHLSSTLFLDYGEGFSDECIERGNANLTEEGFSVLFSGKSLRSATQIRWDPLEGHACKIRICEIETDGVVQNISSINAESKDKGTNEYLFYSYDPQFLIEGDFQCATYMKIVFQCNILHWSEGYYAREKDIEQLNNRLTEQLRLERERQAVMDKLSAELERKKQEINHIELLMKESRLSSAAKIVLYGGIERGKKFE